MDIDSGLSKILSPMEKYGTWIGGGVNLLQPGSMNDLLNSIQNLVNGQAHLPEWNNFIGTQLPNATNWMAVAAAIIGYMGKDAVNKPALKHAFGLLQKGATGWLIVQLANTLLYVSTHSPGSGSTLGSSGSAPWAPNTQPYQSVYQKGLPTSGGFYTQTSGQRLRGNDGNA
jgi:hypothetical protein